MCEFTLRALIVADDVVVALVAVEEVIVVLLLRPRAVHLADEEEAGREHDGEADLEDAEMACEAVPSLAGLEDECKADAESTLQLEAYANAAKAVHWASRGNLNPDA